MDYPSTEDLQYKVQATWICSNTEAEILTWGMEKNYGLDSSLRTDPYPTITFVQTRHGRRGNRPGSRHLVVGKPAVPLEDTEHCCASQYIPSSRRSRVF